VAAPAAAVIADCAVPDSSIDRPTERPRLRGVLHHYAFYGSLVSGALLVACAPSRRTLVALVYGLSVSALLGVSALYHRITWSVAARRRMGRLDHSMINVAIAGTFMLFGIVALSGTLLVIIWVGALANMLLHLLWLDAPKWLSAVTYLALGWLGVAGMPSLLATAGWAPTALLAAGGLIYSAGAVVYALRRPDPLPAVFGYHEVFHALVVVAAVVHYAAVALTILPA
jgi:hemolysin III